MQSLKVRCVDDVHDVTALNTNEAPVLVSHMMHIIAH